MRLQDARSFAIRYQQDTDPGTNYIQDLGASDVDVLVLERALDLNGTGDDIQYSAGEIANIRGGKDQAILGYLSVGSMQRGREYYQDNGLNGLVLPSVSDNTSSPLDELFLRSWELAGPGAYRGNTALVNALIDWARDLRDEAGMDGAFLDVVNFYSFENYRDAFHSQTSNIYSDAEATRILAGVTMDIVTRIKAALGDSFQLMLGHAPFLINDYRFPGGSVSNPPVDEALISSFRASLDGALVEGQDFTARTSQTLINLQRNLVGDLKGQSGFGDAALFALMYENAGTSFDDAETARALAEQAYALGDGFIPYSVPGSGGDSETFNAFHLSGQRSFDGDGQDNGLAAPAPQGRINAGAGNDSLLGTTGRDALKGDRGNDVLDGQTDSLTDLSLGLNGFGIRDFTPATGWTSTDLYPRLLADVNSDGRDDIVAFGETGVFLALSRGDGTFRAGGQATNSFDRNSGWTSQNDLPRHLADMNGDGIVDLVGFGIAGTYLALGQGDGTFGTARLMTHVFSQRQGWTSQDATPRLLADMDGDGDVDIVGFGSTGVFVGLNNGAGTITTIQRISTSFDGNSGFSSQNITPRSLADLDGDGDIDIVAFGSNGVYAGLNDGSGAITMTIRPLATSYSVLGGWTSQDRLPRFIADIDGDGDQDIVGFGFSGVLTSLNDGSGGFGSPEPYLTNQFQYSVTGYSSQTATPRLVGDITGDGAADVTGFGRSGVVTATSSGGPVGDVFVFDSANFGQDQVLNFQQQDILDFRGSGFRQSDLSVSQQVDPLDGIADTLISISGTSNSIVLEDFDNTLLTSSNYLFIDTYA